jgi:hypothetical protein
MSDQSQNRLLVARLLRRQRQMNARPIQFSLRSLLIGITILCLWLGLTAVRPADVPLFFHYWVTALWVGIIVGVLVSRNALSYFVGGAAGNVLVSPLTFFILHHDRNSAWPLQTLWWMSFVFATCASLTGGIYCLWRGKVLTPPPNIVAFAVSVVAFVATA